MSNHNVDQVTQGWRKQKFIELATYYYSLQLITCPRYCLPSLLDGTLPKAVALKTSHACLYQLF